MIAEDCLISITENTRFMFGHPHKKNRIMIAICIILRIFATSFQKTAVKQSF